jgi:hypothetical protein
MATGSNQQVTNMGSLQSRAQYLEQNHTSSGDYTYQSVRAEDGCSKNSCQQSQAEFHMAKRSDKQEALEGSFYFLGCMLPSDVL